MSERDVLRRREVAAIEDSLAEAKHRAEWDLCAPERRQKYLQECEDRRQELKEILTNGNLIRSFACNLVEYDGRFSSPAEITAAIKKAGEICRENNGLTKQEFAQLHLLLETIGTVAPNCDISREDVWQTCLTFLRHASEMPVEETYQPLEFSRETQTDTKKSTEPKNPFHPLSHEGEAWTMRHYDSLWGQEMAEVVRAAFQSLAETSGRTWERETQIEVIRKFQERSAMNRRGISPSIEQIRKSAIILFGADVCGATDVERDWDYLRTDESSSDQFRRNLQLGATKSFDPNMGGYTAR